MGRLGLIFGLFLMFFLVTCTSPTATIIITPTLINQTTTSTPTPVFTLTPSPTNTVTPSPTSTNTLIPSPTLIGGSGKIILTTTICTSHSIGYPDCDSQAVILVNLVTGEKQELAGKGYKFRALSPDGKSILISKDNVLLLKQLADGDPIQITNIFAGDNAGNYGLVTWLPDKTHIAFVGRQKTWFDIYLVNRDGTDLKRITEPNSSAYQIIPSNDPRAIYWEKAKKNTSWGYWKTNLDGTDQHYLDKTYRVVFPQIGNLMASAKYSDGLVVSNLDGSNATTVFTLQPPGFFWLIAISPSGKQLFFNVCADKSCDPMPYHLTSSDGKSVKDLQIEFTAYHAWWSPDEKNILIVDSVGDDRRGYTNIDLLDVENGKISSLQGVLGLATDEFILRSEIAWLP